MDKVKQIDLEKRRIESKYIPPLRAIFRNMAADAKALYLATKNINAPALALNYRPEFLKVCRDAQRETIKFFGFDIREMAEEKGFNFKAAKQKALIEYQIDTKDVGAVLDVGQVEKINNTFALDSALFVANSSEQQADYITQTNEKEISDAEKMAVILFFTEVGKIGKRIEVMQEDLRRLEFEGMLGGSQSIAAVKKKRLRDKIAAAEEELRVLQANKEKFIADTIERNLIEKGISRSELISSQNVGMAEAWARQREAELVNQNIPEIEVTKRWVGILDSHIRPTHLEADLNPANQYVPVDEYFIVGGYRAKMPRADNLPIQETANCRCVAVYQNQ